MKPSSLAFLTSFSLATAGGSGCGNPPAPTCDRDNGGCDPNAACVERTGGRVCICHPWYSGNGQTCTLSGVQAGSPWPVEGGNVRNTGQSSYLGPQTNKVKWSADTEVFAGWGGPVVDAGGTIYVGGPKGFHAYSPDDGSPKWQYSVSGNNFRWSTPALGSNGTLYVQGGTVGELFALDTADNPPARVKWSYQTFDNQSAPNLGADGMVYAASYLTSSTDDGKLYAFDPDAATHYKWDLRVGPVNNSSPAIGSDGTIFVATAGANGSLFAIGPDGTRRWSKLITGGAFFSSPVVGGDGTVYVGTEFGYLYVFDPETGDSRSFELASEIAALALDAGGILYAGSYADGLFAVDPAAIGRENRPRWSVRLQSPVESVSYIAIGADGMIYAVSDRLYAVNPNGSVEWQSEQVIGPNASAPAIGADGTLYVKDKDGVLYAFGQ